MAENDEKAAEAAPKKEGRPVITRRALCVGLGGTAALVGLGAVRYAGSARWCARPEARTRAPSCRRCIRCEKCYEVCPRGVIAPAHLEDGLLNMRTPVMDFGANWCDWCTEENGGEPLCVASCPTEALKPGSTPRPACWAWPS
ncbi:MAG: 4Fe-4S binding protein [Adlercreutzia equolifaciens]